MESEGDHDERLMAVLEQAQLRPLPEREAYVRFQCGADGGLCHEVLEALEWEERMGSFLCEPFLEFAEAAPPFETGQLISDRFEIVREIGTGGMGVVYEAVDRKRHQKIAIKAAKPGFQRLLSPELEGALHVRHRNICLVNQIHTAQTRFGEIDFLTMELLEGETLASRISSQGKLPHEEALDIALQLCAGVAEAHRSGILHRDLKSGNVLVCPGEGEAFRVVITDFGLATPMALASEEAGGTPGYMAPELWSGVKASKASDIYALGVILYQMITGAMPYAELQGDASHQASSVILPGRQKLEADGVRTPTMLPPPPSARVRNLDPRWDKVIMGCLALSPAERTQDVAAVTRELQKKRIPKAPFVAAAVLIAVVSTVVSAVPIVRTRVVEFFVPPNVRLAVLPFQAPPELRHAADGTAREVYSRLEAMSGRRRNVAFISPATARSLHVETPKQAEDVLHATHALDVQVQKENGSETVHARVIDLKSQLAVRDLSAQYPADATGNIPTALAGLVAAAFSLRDSNRGETLSTVATPPYLEGLALLGLGGENVDQSTSLFQQAATLDPRSPLPLTGLVQADIAKYEMTRGNQYLQQAEQVLAKAQSMNPDSARVLLASGLLNETRSQYLKALADYRRVQELEPRNIDALLRVGDIYNKLDMPEEAASSYLAAVNLDPNYYDPYESLGEFYYYRGKYQESADYFRKTVEHAPGMFNAYANLGSVLVELKRDDEAEKALLQSLHIRETARALNSLGALRAYQGRDPEAIGYYEKALTHEPNQLIYLVNAADCYRRLGRSRDAKATYRKALQLAAADLVQNPRLARSRAYVGYFAARLGDRGRAHQEISEALALAPRDSNVIRRAVLTYEALGERDQAFRLLRDAPPSLVASIARHPDMADFCRDPRFKQVMIAEGGQ